MSVPPPAFEEPQAKGSPGSAGGPALDAGASTAEAQPEEEATALPPCEGKAGAKAWATESPFDAYFNDGACSRLRVDDPELQVSTVVQVRSQGVLESRGVTVARLVIESNESYLARRLSMYVPRFVWRDAKRAGELVIDEDDRPSDPSVLEDVARRARRGALPAMSLPVAERPFTVRGGLFRRWVREGATSLFCEGEIRGLHAWCADECSSTVCFDPAGGVAYLGGGAGYPVGEFVKEGAALPLARLQDPWAGKRPNDR
ncbi:MAG TPA: hypothetical protein VFS43_06145 [Polyangiaceae bacterium]|nr:hypothetical protein [Polyangiaceae bacterium]